MDGNLDYKPLTKRIDNVIKPNNMPNHELPSQEQGSGPKDNFQLALESFTETLRQPYNSSAIREALSEIQTAGIETKQKTRDLLPQLGMVYRQAETTALHESDQETAIYMGGQAQRFENASGKLESRKRSQRPTDLQTLVAPMDQPKS